MDACPKCGSKKIHRSRTKNVIERAKRKFTHHRPFRCEDCEWRGWGEETVEPFRPEHTQAPEGPQPDLDAIDHALERPPSTTKPNAPR